MEEMTDIERMKRDLIYEYGLDLEDVANMSDEEVVAAIDDIEDTSWAHPNETFEDFMEHEDSWA